MQQLPQSISTDAPSEVTAIRRQRARRIQLTAAGVAGTLLALLATGCPEPADLANPELYPAPAIAGTSSTGGGSGGGGAGGDPCELDCVKKVFSGSPTSCKLCHGPTLQSSGLELAAANFTARLRDQPAKHMDIVTPPSPGDCPTGDKLIDVADPAKSWLLAKIKGQQKTCGDRMPSQALGATEMACVETYVYCVAGKPQGGGSGGSAAGGTSAGTGGAAAGTGGGGGTGGT